jgi:flagellar assembly protein FliH
MSSSARLAPSPSSQGAAAERKPPEASPFPYSEVTISPAGPGFAGSQPSGGGIADHAAAIAPAAAEREAQARALGREQGALEGRAKYEEQLLQERSAVAAALADFARERAAYYAKIEEQAVRLALSIARKILHREAQVDPQLLMGIVRVALERIEGATGVVLAVHPQQAMDWQRFLASRLEPGDLPEIVEDAALPPERCQLRTSMGTADLGLEVQLREIEQGLMDLLAARPGEKP